MPFHVLLYMKSAYLSALLLKIAVTSTTELETLKKLWYYSIECKYSTACIILISMVNASCMIYMGRLVFTFIDRIRCKFAGYDFRWHNHIIKARMNIFGHINDNSKMG